ncbi:unnamed protein product [Choristocarpus tenellus]
MSILMLRRCVTGKAGRLHRGFCDKQTDFLVTGSLLDARRRGVDVPSKGQYLTITHKFGPQAVSAFAKYTGDDNPIHLDDQYAKGEGHRAYQGCIVHGLLVSGLFSATFGRSIPGAIYISQSLRFEMPVPVGALIEARVEVERSRVTSSGNEVFVQCSTIATLEGGLTAISGQAQVLLPKNCNISSSCA